MENNRLVFRLNWQEVSDFPIQGEELVATWASFSILYGEEVISKLIDKKSDTIKDDINLPLYPLAEWIALNWWFLLYEPFTPNKFDLKEYNSRHNFSFAREGYALPNFSIIPLGENALLEWKRAKLINHKVEFIESGQAKISIDNLKEDLYDFVDKIVNRLHVKGISGTLLQEEWESIQNLDSDELEFCKVSASAGIDPFNITVKQSEIVTSIYSKLPKDIVNDFFTSCNPSNLENEAGQTITAIGEIESNELYIENLNILRDRIQLKSVSGGLPWTEGYESAKRLRNELKLNGHIFKDINEIGDVLKVSHDELSSIIAYKDLPSSISIVSGLNRENSPYFVIANKVQANPRKENFAYCRAIYDYLFLIDSRVSLITKTHVESQKINRAFAAEFLVPSEKLKKFISHEIVTEEQIEDLADIFFVDPLVIKHQIENHHISKIEYFDSDS